MPWCETCSRFLNPPSLGAAGECPTCGTVLVEPKETPRVPWHFKLLVGTAAVYLGWRAVQGVGWVLDRLT